MPIRIAYSSTGHAPVSSPWISTGTGSEPSARRMRTPSATAVSGSDTVDSASTLVVPCGTPLVRSVTASPLVQTPSSTPMPTALAAAHTSIQPFSCTLTEHTSGLPTPRCPQA
jgi:hypothetical protein